MYITLEGWRISNNGFLSKGKRFRLIMIVLQFSAMHFDFINFLADIQPISSNEMKIFSILVKLITQFEEIDKVHIYFHH